MKVLAFTSIDGSGQKITEAVLEYENELDAEKVSADCFSIPGRMIMDCYVSDTGRPGRKTTSGRYIILELNTHDEASEVGIKIGTGNHGHLFIKECVIYVCQTKKLFTVRGECIPSNSLLVKSSQVISPEADLFSQYLYRNDMSENSLAYNLYLPKGYTPEKEYPLVVFIHDAGACSDSIQAALFQGLGAVCWVRNYPEECIVLAPNYTRAIVNDNFEYTWEVDMTKELIDFIIMHYSIDKKRVYGTGQSMGCMTLCQLSSTHPELFTACLLVAGQWDPEKMKNIATRTNWIIVSQGDEKAFPGMNACVESMENAGAKVVVGTLDAKLEKQLLHKRIQTIASKEGNLKYTYFEGNSLIPEGEKSDPGKHHVYTWQLAYQLDGLLDWLLQQKKEKNNV